MNQIMDLIKEKKYVINASSLKLLKTLDLSVNEILFIIFFDNANSMEFDLPLLMEDIGLSNEEVMVTLDSLMKKKLVTLDTGKDNYNKSVDIINLEGFYNILEDQYNSKIKNENKENIYEAFSKEFNRKLTSMEYEIINAWLSNGYSEELVLGALKEAVFNGVNNFRYIDKILLEWHKKGFKTMKDVKTSLVARETNNNGELFDYNWLEEE